MKSLLLFLLVLSPGAFAQMPTALRLPATGPSLASFIPAGYGILPDAKATGDLNYDGRPDVALVLRPLAEDRPGAKIDSLPPRLLLVLLRTPAGYRRAAQSAQLILCKGCGGVWGGPLESIAIERGVLTVFHHDGSSARWNVTTKFRYQKGDFYLIGESRVRYHTSRFCGQAGRQFQETDFVTGEYRQETDSERCRPLVRKRGRRPPQPLRRLTDYAVEP
ncbi:MAG: hypothetical protein M3Y54_19800 [Bacteroidota bacterium]|nr:hypothetical protein [Bacteroidota bacterium]